MSTWLQLARLNEVEDTVVQQDNQIAALSERIRSLQAEVQKWRAREEATTINLSKEKERLIEGGYCIFDLSSVWNTGMRP